MQPENQLVARAKAGDIQAFSRLVELNSDRMYGAAYRILLSKDQAEDCVQEAFLKMYLKLDTFNYQSKFSTWLYSVTVNVALDYRRKNARHSSASDDGLDQLSTGEANAPEKASLTGDLGDALIRAIDSLNDDVKTAFILRHFEERSIEEITQILGVSASTVKSRIFRGVGRLRQLLRPQLGDQVGDYETVD